MSNIEDIIDEIGLDKIKVSINIATGLIAAGKEILDFLKSDVPVDDIQLLRIIEKQNDAKDQARALLIDSIAKRKNNL